MTMQPPKRLPHQRRLGAIATGLALAGAMLAPGVAQAFGFPPFSLPDTISTNEDTADDRQRPRQRLQLQHDAR